MAQFTRDTFVEVSGIARVTKNPVLRHTPDGTPVTSVNVAYTEFRTLESAEIPEGLKKGYRDGEAELATFVSLTLWRDAAVNAAKYLSKGRLVWFRGILKGDQENGVNNPRQWTGQDGVVRTSYDVLIVSGRDLKYLPGNGGSVSTTAYGDPPPENGVEEVLPF